MCYVLMIKLKYFSNGILTRRFIFSEINSVKCKINITNSRLNIFFLYYLLGIFNMNKEFIVNYFSIYYNYNYFYSRVWMITIRIVYIISFEYWTCVISTAG